MIVREVMTLMNNDQDEYDSVANYWGKMELYHMHYHSDHRENLGNKIVVVEVQYHFQLKEHNVLMEMMLDYYHLFQISEEKEMKLSYGIQYQIPRRI
jgi:hypothetical protein